MRNARIGVLATLLAMVSATAVTGAGAQTVRGSVVDGATRRPVPGATVMALVRPDSIVAVTIADSAGQFSITLRGAGEYAFFARRVGYDPGRTDYGRVNAGESRTIAIELRAAPTILAPVRSVADVSPVVRGIVVDSSSRLPMPGVTVRLVAGDTTFAAMLTGVDGAFRMVAPKPGSYVVAARRLGYQPIAAPEARLEAGATRTLRFELGPASVLLDTVRAQANRRFLSLTSGRVWFARHYGEGKGVFFDGLEVALSRTSVCDYFANIPGLKYSGELETVGVRGIRCNDNRKLITSTGGSLPCLGTRVDRSGAVVALEKDLVYVRFSAEPDTIPIWIGDIKGVEIFRSRDEMPRDFSVPPPRVNMPSTRPGRGQRLTDRSGGEALRNCVHIQLWTDMAW